VAVPSAVVQVTTAWPLRLPTRWIVKVAVDVAPAGPSATLGKSAAM